MSREGRRWLKAWLWAPAPGEPQPPKAAGQWAPALNLLLAALAATILLVWALKTSLHQWNWESVWPYRQLFFQGWMMTLALSFSALCLSVVGGALVALLRRSRFLPARSLARLYIEVVRGTPLLVILLVGFYGVANAVGLQDRYVAGTLILAFFASAYISEIIRGGVESVSETTLESARAAGLSKWQTARWIVFPLATRNILPALTGQFALLVKDSSLLSVISVSELTLNAQQAASRTFSTLECYLPLALGYLLITLPISAAARALEKRLHYEA